MSAQVNAAANRIARAYFDAVSRGDENEARLAHAIQMHVQAHAEALGRLGLLAAVAILDERIVTQYAYGLTVHAENAAAYVSDAQGRDDERFLTDLAAFAQLVGRLGEELSRPGAVRPRDPAGDGGVGEALSSTHLAFARTIALSALARGAVREVRGLRKPLPAREEAAERMRRIRKKRARGFAVQVPVNLYDADIEMLRSFGFVAAGGTQDKNALGMAVEAFLFSLMMGHRGTRETWAEKLEMNAARLEAIAGNED